MSNLMDKKELIANVLKMGKRNAISRDELCEITGVSDRENRRLIHQLRKDGRIILSNTDTGGYYYPATLTEAVKCERSMNNRGVKCFEASKAMREWIKAFEPNFVQEELEI